jgi:DNA polymerase-1
VKVLVLTDTPLKEGYKGMEHVFVAKTMDALDVDWTTESVFPHMPEKVLAKMKQADWAKESERLHAAAIDAERVLFMGGLPIAAFAGLKKVPSIKKIEGLGFWCDPGVMSPRFAVATYLPSTVMKDPEFYRDFLFAVEKLIERERPEPEQVVETYTSGEHGFDWTEGILDQLQQASAVACDIETTGFSPVSDQLISVGFAAVDGHSEKALAVILDGEEGFAQARRFIDSYQGELVFHNVKFDMPRLHRWLGCKREDKIADTMLMHYLIDERSDGKYKAHGLKRLARHYFDAPDYGGNIVEDYIAGRVGKEALYPYQALDCAYTVRLYFELRDRLWAESERFMELHSRFMVPAAIAVGHMEATGIRIDVPYLEAMRERLGEEISADMEAIRGMVFALTGREDFKPGSHQQVRTLLFSDFQLPRVKGKNDWKRKTDGPATDKTVLQTLARQVAKERPEVAAVIRRILAWRQRAKIASTNVEGILKRVDTDGRLRGHFGMANTATGRISCSKPNLQNIDNKGKALGIDVKKAFIAEEGHVLIEADFSQLELRVAAQFSGDPKMVETFERDEDIHQTVAWELYHKPKDKVTKTERVLAKTVSFGSIYGLSAEGLYNSEVMADLEEQGIPRWSVKQIESFQGAFRRGFAVLYNWIDKTKIIAARQRYIENPLGFRRRFLFTRPWDVGGQGRQAVNTPIQGFAGQVTLWALVLLRRALDPAQARTVLTVHDSIMVEAKEEYADTAARIIVDVMQTAVERMEYEFGLTDPHDALEAMPWSVPFKAEVAVGKTWSDTA